MRSSTIGRSVKAGDNTPMGNPELQEFIKILYSFWHDILGRALIQKYDGINGRKQFLEFLIECLKPIHPSLVVDQIIQDGTVDNALKKYQKSLKSS